jgi:hypothetical protein
MQPQSIEGVTRSEKRKKTAQVLLPKNDLKGLTVSKDLSYDKRIGEISPVKRHVTFVI